MEASEWRQYRRHQIVARKGGLFGRKRFEVWDRGNLLGTFRDVVRAELHVDAQLSRE